MTIDRRARGLVGASFSLLMLGCAPEAPRAEARAMAAETASLFADAPEQRWRLPPRLREISGLATAADGRLFGHDDEHAIVYELDIETGRLLKNFALGDPIAAGDFEGLAIDATGDFWLVTSAGVLHRFEEGADGAHVAFDTYETGLSEVCEVEGLAFARAPGRLILACKTMHQRAMRGAVRLYSWSPDAPRAAAQPAFAIPFAEIAALLNPSGQERGAGAVHPSGVEIDPASGRILIAAARERVLLEADFGGALLSARRLDGAHTQAEGVTVGPRGALVIADEAGDARALLTRYPRRP